MRSDKYINMGLSLKIARKYLFSKRNHSVINILSAVSAAAVGVGCAALIIILSVFNGFNSLVTKMYSEGAPDFTIEPSSGKVMTIRDFSADVSVIPVVEEKAYLQFDDYQQIGTIKGVPSLPDSLVMDSITVYIPTRTEDISLLAPTESVNSARVPYCVTDEYLTSENGKILIPLDIAQSLLEYSENECNRLEIFAKSSDKKELKRIKALLLKEAGEGYVVKDFYEQNATIYKMMHGEKLAVYLILFFVIIIIGVNIISSVAIMILEKRGDIQTLKTMGAEGSLLRRTFTLHGALICMSGAVAGLVIGLIICWLQTRYGLVTLPGNFVTSVYPVEVRLSDVLIILAGILAICISLSYIPSRFVK